MSEQHHALNRSLLRIVCRTEATGNLIADRLEELERENAALKIERNRYKVALQDIADASGEWAGDKAREVLRKEAQP